MSRQEETIDMKKKKEKEKKRKNYRMGNRLETTIPKYIQRITFGFMLRQTKKLLGSGLSVGTYL